MKQVHGKFNSFQEMGKAMGIKAQKSKAEKPEKCPRCGQQMHRVDGTNVWACGNPYIIEAKLKGEPVQVFGESCPQTITVA